MKEKWVMVCGSVALNTCLASSYAEANEFFYKSSRYEDWSKSDILSEADWMSDIQSPSDDDDDYDDYEESYADHYCRTSCSCCSDNDHEQWDEE
jgi:hypothetical protein